MPDNLNVPAEAGSVTSSINNSNEDEDERQTAMGYQQTLMYGRYSKALGDYAREEAKRQKYLGKWPVTSLRFGQKFTSKIQICAVQKFQN